MTDRELLVLAARAAYYVIESFVSDNPNDGVWVYKKGSEVDHYGEMPIFKWNPLTDDGDALRLAVKLGLIVCVCHGDAFVKVIHENIAPIIIAFDNGDPYEATRRAIVMAAAEIGRGYE